MDVPLRIAFVALNFPPDIGGSEAYNVECAHRLHARGHELRVFTWERGNPAEAEADGALGFEVHREAIRLHRGVIDPGGLASWLGRARQDVVFVSRASKRLRRVTQVAARFAPLVLSVHDLGAKHGRRGPLGRWRARRRYGFDRARGIVAISEDIRRRIETLHVPAPISVVYPGVDTKRFAPDALARERSREQLGLTGRKVLLTVSRLAASKRHVRVIETLPALRRRVPEVFYLIVGDGSEREALAARAAELGVSDIVKFTGIVEDTRLYHAACDVFVMPSGRPSVGKGGEGFGIAYVEAGACGVPVVASSSGAGAEIVVDGETGSVIDPDDASALERALGELLADPTRAKRLGDAARRRCERFDWEHGIEGLVVALRAAARRR